MEHSSVPPRRLFILGPYRIDTKLPLEIPSSDESREKLAKRQTNAAVALLRMNQPAKVWPLLQHSPDPRVRSYLIHRLSPLGADAQAIVKRLDEEPDITIRRALLLSLGEFKETEFTPDDRTALLPKLQELYQTASNPGLHGAAEWLLRQWQQEAWLTQVNDEWAKDKEGREKKIAGIKEFVTKEKEKALPQWYVNSQGQTMVLIPGPVEFLMGYPERRGGDAPHRRRISRSFALAGKPVTVDEFKRFKKNHSNWFQVSGDLPVSSIDWYQAAKYCNWLSEQDGLPMDQLCYEISDNEIKLKASYLSLGGYRLPTEAEMEYATRAEAITTRFFGETIELLPEYARYSENSGQTPMPVGRLKPNDLGLFDMHGNVFTWCQESRQAYPSGANVHEDQEDSRLVTSTLERVIRGGSFTSPSGFLNSAERFHTLPTNGAVDVGFRVARTLQPADEAERE